MDQSEDKAWISQIRSDTRSPGSARSKASRVDCPEDDRALARMLGVAFLAGLAVWGALGWVVTKLILY